MLVSTFYSSLVKSSPRCISPIWCCTRDTVSVYWIKLSWMSYLNVIITITGIVVLLLFFSNSCLFRLLNNTSSGYPVFSWVLNIIKNHQIVGTAQADTKAITYKVQLSVGHMNISRNGKRNVWFLFWYFGYVDRRGEKSFTEITRLAKGTKAY